MAMKRIAIFLARSGMLAALGSAAIAAAQTPAPEWPAAPPFVASYPDIVDLADSAPLVVRVQPRSLAPVSDSAVGSRGVMPGTARFYVEAQTISLVVGQAALAPRLAFLADLPVDARGKPPVLKKAEVLVFARPVPGNPGYLTLVAPDALLIATPENTARVRAVLTGLVQPDAPAHITGVREIVHVGGNLAGEGETQVFLKTGNGSPASLTIVHKPGVPTRWGASFSELTANIDAPPQPDTLVWYRLACALPRDLPDTIDSSDAPVDRAAALEDYRFVLSSLGECKRLRRTAG